jgi:hypothetical protein
VVLLPALEPRLLEPAPGSTNGFVFSSSFSIAAMSERRVEFLPAFLSASTNEDAEAMPARW